MAFQTLPYATFQTEVRLDILEKAKNSDIFQKEGNYSIFRRAGIYVLVAILGVIEDILRYLVTAGNEIVRSRIESVWFPSR